jgi:hypothetical protein
MTLNFETRNGVPQCTLENFQELSERHLLHGVVAQWAKEKPDAVAIINADTKQEITPGLQGHRFGPDSRHVQPGMATAEL